MQLKQLIFLALMHEYFFTHIYRITYNIKTIKYAVKTAYFFNLAQSLFCVKNEIEIRLKIFTTITSKISK